MHQLSVDALGHRCVHGDESPANGILLQLAAGVDGGRRPGRLADDRGMQAGKQGPQDVSHEPEQQERYNYLYD
jgi:hypothetical protein